MREDGITFTYENVEGHKVWDIFEVFYHQKKKIREETKKILKRYQTSLE